MSIGHVELGQRLRALRKQASETVVETADAVGSTHGHLSALELGRIKRPSFKLLQALANHFGMTSSELTGETIRDPEIIKNIMKGFGMEGRRCLKCKSEALVIETKQTRSGDEGMTHFIICLALKPGMPSALDPLAVRPFYGRLLM